jgi:4-amino-4-deoxy-L-arabinose transferase-like glycosyltransferase
VARTSDFRGAEAVAARPSKASDAWWIGAAAAVIALCHLWLAVTRGVNWDEFHYYDAVRQFDAGTLIYALQTLHAQLFGWLLRLPGDVVDHIRTARIVMVACELGAALALFGLARRFASNAAAALTALAYLSGGNVVIHGGAFRTDPQATLLLTTALWLLASARLRPASVIAFGLLTGLAAMVTIKVAFWAPAFAGIAWLRWRESPLKLDMLRRLAACVGASLVAFLVLYAWHSSQVAPNPVAAASTVGSAGRVVFSEGLVPQWPALRHQLVIAPHIPALLLLTVLFWPWLARSRDRGLAMLGLLLPLAVLLVYRNSYPYFFVFLLPPVVLATAPAMDRIIVRWCGVAAPAVLMAGLAVYLAWGQPRDVVAAQKRIIAVAHQVFPQPVAYFDFCGYLGDYERALPFMPSGWGLAEYRRAGRPVFVEAMDRKTVPLLMVNHNVFFSVTTGVSRGEDLLEADVRALRESYIPHWGILWVAGKQIPAGDEAAEITVRVPGRYTLERGELVLDGVRYRSGQTLELERGIHRIGGPRPDQATLRWGDHLKAPAEPVPVPGPYATLD